MSLMTDMLRQSIANSGVSVRVGDSRNLEPSKDEGTRSDDDNAWKYISVGDFSGLSDYTDREYDYRKIPFFGQFFGHAADAATDGIASLAQFAGFEKAGNFLHNEAQKGEAQLPSYTKPSLSLDYITDPNGLTSAAGMVTGSMLSIAPVAALIPESAVAGAVTAASKVPKIGGPLSRFVGNAIRWAPTGPVEAAMEGGAVEREMLENGASREDANRAAWDVFKGNAALLTATNAVEGGLLGKLVHKAPTFSNPIANTFSKIFNYVPQTAAEMAVQGYEEGAQEGISRAAMGQGEDSFSQILNPVDWTDEQWDAAKMGAAGSFPLVGGTAMMHHLQGALSNSEDTEDAPAANNAPTLTSGNAEIDDAIVSAAAKHGLPADLLFAVAQTESDFNQSVVSEAGAKGIMQLMPDTAAALGVDADDMAQNIDGGAKYLRQQLDAFDGDVAKALAAYNAGPQAVKDHGGVPPYEETQNYVAKIMGILDGANMNPATEAEPTHSLLDDAEPFIGTRMVNGARGCVEAVTKIGAAGSDFLRAELEAGVVNVDRLVKDAGDRVIPFDPSKLEEGDVIVYGDDTDSQQHVVLYDGKGGYIGNSSDLKLVVHRNDYNAMGSLYPTKIIKSGGRYGGTVNISSVSGSVRPIDYSGLVVDAKNLQANAAAMKALIEGDKLTPAQKAAIIDAAEIIRDTPTEASTASPGEDALDYNAWQRLIDHKDIKGIFAKDPERVTRMVMRGEETQRKAQTVAAIENQQKVAQAQSVQAQVQAAAQAQPVANPAESAARLASVQQELSMPPMAQQEIAARLASYAQTTPHDVERVVIQNGLAHGDFSGIARALPAVYRAAAGRWMQQPQEQAQAQPQAQPQPQTQPPAMPTQQDMQVPDVAVPPSQEMTAQMPQQMQGQAQAVPTTEDLADIRQKLAALDAMMQGNPTYVEARRRGDWQTAAQEAAKAGHHDFARFYQMLHEKATGAPINITPYQNPAEKAAAEQGAVRPTPAPVPINHVDSMRPIDIPKSYGARRDFGRGLIKAMRMRNLPDVRALNDDLRNGEKRAIEHALKRIAQVDAEDALLRGETAAQRANDNETVQAESREKQGDDVQVESAQKQGKEKTANEGGLELADGYTTESGRPLSEADEKEFIIKPNGSRNFGEITKTISDAVMQQSGEKLEIGEIRLRVGNHSEGLIHAKAHEKQAQDAGYDSIENLIADVAENYDQIYMRAPVEAGQNPTYSLVKLGNKSKGVMNRVAPIYFELQADGGGNYYIVVSAMPKGDKTLAKQTKKDRLIYSSPGLDAATESNAGAVSASARNVGADSRGGSPTSDKSSGLVTSTIPSDVSESKQKRVSNANGEGNGSTNKSNKNEPSVSAGPVSSREALGTPPVDGSSVSNIPSEQEKSKEKSVQAKSAPLTKQEQEALTGTSEEAKEAYRTVRDKLAKSKNKAVVRAAKVGATLFARHADIYAKAYSKATGKPYTALDYMRDRFGLDVDGTEVEANADGLKQHPSTDVLAAQKEAVRKQYGGAAQWMKAPNGEATNLTEEQWLTVRTPAFKAWFGDWEHDAASASKVVDENGEPLVVYHGTPLGGFDTFKRQQNYFTSMKWYADRYQDESTSSNFVPDKHENPGEKMTYAVFLNIRKPFDTRNRKERKIFEKEFYRQWGYGAPLSDKGLPDWTDGDDLQEFFEENGYDYDGLLLDEGGIPDNHEGVISRGISYVTFEPNQIKSVDNNGAFSVDDMNIFNQRAWVGSAANFDKFDMGYVGTGEGAQVHGYGLYSAQGRNVAEGYKEKLSALLNEAEGDPVDYNYVEVIQFNGYRYEKPEGYDLWTFEPGTADEVYIDDPGEDAVLEKLNEVQDVDKARAFFEEELEAKRKGEWGETEYSEDTLEKAVAMLSPDNIYDEAFEVSTEEPPEPEAFGGTLFEVEIPDDDVLLDEQKPLAEQPKKVLQGLRKTLKSLSVDELNRFLKQAAYGEEEYSKIQQELQTLSILVSAPISVGRGGRFGKHALRSHGYSDEDIADFQAHPEHGRQEAVRLREKYAPRIKELKKQTRAFATRYLRDEYVMQNRTGRNFYQALSAAYASDKEASQTLNKYGIKGITYVGQQDGRCFVIFDDKAIEVINKFNQRMNSIRKGSITPQASGRRIISLFEQADESTFLHEMGHMFLMDLEDLAAIDAASAEDLETVRDWATWQEGQAKEYEDTPWQKEFSEREKALLAAKKRGDVVEVRKLRREWEQERFARGFERYLETGKAPTSVLKRIFQKFKKFLQSIYQAFKGTGGKASPEVEAVMGRMIAEEEQGASSEFDGNPVQEKSAPIPADFSASKLKGAIGKTTSIATDSGEEIPVRYRLVDARSLVTSNSAKDFTKNPAYPKSLQPRDRERANMQQQIREMASRLRPEDLAASRSVNLGAPVVRADGVVLNGNGRAIAITRALLGNTFRDSTGKGYRAFLVEHAEEFGFKPETVQRMKAPMLVREVTGGLNAEQVKAVTTSTAGGSRLGASEQAKQDAEKITLEDLARYEENERGDLTTAANRDFVAGILYRVAGKNDVNAYTDAKGQVNADGIQRVKRALFQKAYGDDDLLSRMSESTNDDTRNITNGLTIAAPYIARANEKMARGTAHNYKLGETIADAVKRYNHLHGIGQSVENYLDQQAMFAEYEDSPEVREVLRALNENRRSGKRIAQFVRRIGEIAEAQGNPNEISLMEGGEPLSLGDVIREAQKGLNAAKAAPILDTLFQEAPALKDAALEYGATEGEKSGARAHFEQLYEEMKKHPETGAFSMAKFSRDNSKPGSMGRFRKLLVGLKIGEAAEGNLEVHRSNKEKQLVISASKLNQFMADKSLTEKNILKTEDLGGGKIRVTYMPQDFHNIHILDWVKSVRQLRKKNPFVKAIYDLGSRAMRLQEHLRNEGAKTVKGFRELTKNKNDHKLVSSILLEGDAAGKEYGVQELRAMGANANVIKAYQLVRRTMREWYKRVNDARMQVETRTKTLSKNDLADFKKNHWIADSDVLSVEEKGGGKVLLTWRGGKTYETKDKVMTKTELDTLLQDKDINVAHFHKLNDSYGVDNYSVDYVERIKPLGNLTGYMPHFFHGWMVYEKHKDPKTGEVRLTTIGSGRSMNDAVRLGNEIARKNSDKEYVVRPKGFDLKVENSVVIGDVDFQQMAAKLAENTEMTLSDANAFLRDNAGATMRARHRFFGNAMHRKGAKGFDTDITYVLTHYLNTSARYIAMEQFKPRAITLYERWFGAFDADPKDATASYVKGLIKDINGDPRQGEKYASQLIMATPFGKMISDAYGDRAALAVNAEVSTWNAISKLGLGNFASAAVNLSQFINMGAAMNDYGYAAAGLQSALNPTAADIKILEESGVLDEINEAADNGGYTQRRFGRVGNIYGAIKRVGELSLLPFQYCDTLMRKAAILGAYKQGVEKLGLSHEEAMERARELNADANFIYSSANAPLMIRWGSVWTQQLFQFQKYPIMQMEFMYNILKNGTMGQKVRFFLPYVLLCGIPGMIPFGEIFNQIFSFLFGLASGDDKDIGNEIKAEALRWAGKDPAKKFIVNWAIYGVLAPTFGIDVSKRIGISGAFSGEFFGAQKPESVGGMLAMQLGGPAVSTAVNMQHQLHNGNPIEALKAFSPALGNMAQAMVGVSRTTRHRVKSRYETAYDRIVHALGFRSVDESNNSFITSYEFDRKDAETHAKQEAIMDYLDDPSEANRQRINALGIKDKAIEEARIQQERSATERAKGGRPKVESGKTSKHRTSHKRKEEKPKKETLFDTIGEEDEGM